MRRILFSLLAAAVLAVGLVGRAQSSFPAQRLLNQQIGATPLPTMTGGGCVVSGANGYLGFAACPSIAATPFPGAIVPTPSATGQMLYSADGATWTLLNIGTSGQCLKASGTPLVPTWTTC